MHGWNPEPLVLCQLPSVVCSIQRIYREETLQKKKIILLIILSLWPQIFSVDHSALVSLAVLVSGKETFSTVIFLPRRKGKTFELFRFQSTYLLNHFC